MVVVTQINDSIEITTPQGDKISITLSTKNKAKHSILIIEADKSIKIKRIKAIMPLAPGILHEERSRKKESCSS
ncbi:MAG: hypothetical protein EHM20_12945 [Alphaproteobacteria bacterium]|nr:MAG: hypothetical protein EHM20_12945 [Alphaproteobacteria bacterium]